MFVDILSDMVDVFWNGESWCVGHMNSRNNNLLWDEIILKKLSAGGLPWTTKDGKTADNDDT